MLLRQTAIPLLPLFQHYSSLPQASGGTVNFPDYLPQKYMIFL